MRRQGGLIKSLLPIILFIALEAFSIALMANNGVIQRYRVMRIAQNIQSYFWSKSSQVTSFFSLREENKVLLKENETLKQELIALMSTSPATDSTSAEQVPKYTLVHARVLKNTVNKQHNYIIIDKGSDDGMEEGMGVINPTGIVGVVNSVSAHYSYVISFLNSSQIVSAMIAKNNVFGPMQWSGERIDRAVLMEIPIHTDVKVGDTIISSGYSIIYPADIPLGIVDTMTVIDGISQEINVTLFQNFKALKYVDVVINREKNEIVTLEGNE